MSKKVPVDNKLKWLCNAPLERLSTHTALATGKEPLYSLKTTLKRDVTSERLPNPDCQQKENILATLIVSKGKYFGNIGSSSN